MEVLKLATAGSVDDGKSTLIGRLLFDTRSITGDILEAVERVSKRKGLSYPDLSLLTDGLVAEREQGITIDVAHIYFKTDKRKFILADTPGHIEYTRNMITGASNAELSIILIDARKGVLEQTYRHYFITRLLGIPNVVVCVNKMDLVDYSEEVFYKIAADFQKLIARAGGNANSEINFLPISALIGDNVVELSPRTPWYKGPSLLEILENAEINSAAKEQALRFPIQLAIRQDSGEFKDYRAFSGKISSGVLKKGDKIRVLPQNIDTYVKEIRFFEDELEQAEAHDSVSVSLSDEIDAGRGSVFVHASQLPQVSKEIKADICWLNESPYVPGSVFVLKHNTNELKAKISEVHFRYDIENYLELPEEKSIRLNDISHVSIRSSEPLIFDSYAQNKATGAFILIDSNSNATVAVGVIR